MDSRSGRGTVLAACSGIAGGVTDTGRLLEWTSGERVPVRHTQEVGVGRWRDDAHAHLLGMAHWVVSLASHQDWVALPGPFRGCIHRPRMQVIGDDVGLVGAGTPCCCCGGRTACSGTFVVPCCEFRQQSRSLAKLTSQRDVCQADRCARVLEHDRSWRSSSCR